MTASAQESVFVFAPEGADEASHFFEECSRLRESGRDIRVGVLESPYRPGYLYGICNPAAIDPGGGSIPVSRTGSDTTEAGRGKLEEYIPVIAGIGDITRKIEAGDGGTALRIFITLKKMGGIREVSGSDYLAVVDGGTRFEDFISEIERTGLYFPCETVCTGDDTTVAELIMDGEAVRTECRFGSLREYVLSVELVTPAGEVIHTGSRAVKDVAGYNITGFLIGAGGICGLISRITFRLLPEPKTRVHFAARGEVVSLRGAAENIHQRLRPAFLEIFEGRAAGLLAERFRNAVPESGGPAPKGSPSTALLIGELQAPGPGMEDGLIGTASGLSGDGVPISRLDPRHVESRRRFLPIALESLDRGAGIICVSFDAGPPPVDIPGALVYRSLYPERVHLLIPCDEGEAAAFGSGEDHGYSLKSVPELGAMLAGGNDLKLRARIDVIYSCGGFYDRRRIGWAGLERLSSGGGSQGPAAEMDRQRAVFDELTSRIHGVFDPKGIMLR